MDKRKELILNTIIKEYIKTGQPVASGILVEKYKLEISPATVRNEMSALETDDYIVQPHTSAGRIPTEKAYLFYLKSIKPKKISQSDSDSLSSFVHKKDESNMKLVAKHLSQLSGNAVFLAFHKHNLYYTGISNLFQQPEFSRINIIHDISGVIDRIDEIINGVIDEINPGVHTMLGSENPFGDIFGTCLAKYKLGDKYGMLGVLGPIRMDYQRTISLVEFLYNKLKD